MTTPVDQFHHYIPRFILRKFSAVECSKGSMIFECDESGQVHRITSRKKKKINNPFIKIISLDGTLTVGRIASSYGITNMYEDAESEDAMEVEKLLARVESDVAIIYQRIIAASVQQTVTTLARFELYLLKKFVFIMSYRSNRRREQYVKENFDAPTWMLMRQFMAANGIHSPQRVWLNNIRTILEFPDLDTLRKANNCNSLFPSIKLDLDISCWAFFFCIWKAPIGTEFLMSDNSFGLWEGCGPGLIYHQFYPVSPCLILVNSSTQFKPDEFGKRPKSFWDSVGVRTSQFEKVPHPIPKTLYKKSGRSLLTAEELTGDGNGVFDRLDEYTYSIVEISNEAVNRINAITIDESKQMSFTSDLLLYKSLKYYYKKKPTMPNSRDVTPMLDTLLTKLRKHQTNPTV